MSLREEEDIFTKVEKAKEQLARLRRQQAELEKEKTELEELRNKHDEWRRGRKEMGEALQRAVAVLESEEAEISRMSVLVHGAREGFSALLDQLAAVNEERWTPGSLKEELQKSLLILQKARNEIGEARARIPALEGKAGSGWAPEGEGGGESAAGVAAMSAAALLRIGFWIALPAAIMALGIAVIFALM